MNDIIKEKRKVLQTLSSTAVELAEDKGIEPTEHTINELIMMLIYNPENEHNFKSFAGWKKEGYTIKKGSKAYMLWGQPINIENKEKTEENNEDNSFFPIAYVFRNDQAIKPIKRTRPKKETPPKVPELVKDLPF